MRQRDHEIAQALDGGARNGMPRSPLAAVIAASSRIPIALRATLFGGRHYAHATNNQKQEMAIVTTNTAAPCEQLTSRIEGCIEEAREDLFNVQSLLRTLRKAERLHGHVDDRDEVDLLRALALADRLIDTIAAKLDPIALYAVERPEDEEGPEPAAQAAA